tara:strand:- start:2388 stop:4889 length:2502 start_codon:yes stop_codon:yes gene_type:complete
MPTYGKENFKESNVNYLNKDFTALKQSLMNYAKSYFPNTYRDFNEASPGMMLLEMNAYVGDVLSFYIDQQYREMLLPLAEERRNIIIMAKMFGYKVKPIVPAYVDLTFTSEVNASLGDTSKIDYSDAGIFDAGIEIVSSTNSDIVFTTLEHIDFKIEQGSDTDTIGTTGDSGLASTYTLSRTTRAVSATEKTITFQVGIPEKFKTFTIPDTNVIDIISCVDSNNNNWYEVDYLAQDRVPITTHYTDDAGRSSAYVDLSNNVSVEAVPYSLTYITSPKRFTRETNQDNTTSLVFGNGVMKDGSIIDEGYLDTEQIGIIIPGQTNDLNNAIDPLLGDEYSTLGETPNNTTLTITYRVGGGLNSNIPSGDISTTPNTTAQNGNIFATLTSVINNSPARGGKDEEDTIEIKERAKAFFTTQNRCVTKEDYEARVLNVPSKFGNIAKAYVSRTDVYGEGDNYQSAYNEVVDSSLDANNYINTSFNEVKGFNNNIADGFNFNLDEIKNITSNISSYIDTDLTNVVSSLNFFLNTLENGSELTNEQIVVYINAFKDAVTATRDGLLVIDGNLNTQLDNTKNNFVDGSGILNTHLDNTSAQSATNFTNLNSNIDNLLTTPSADTNISTINIYVLGYNNLKQLVGNPYFSDTQLPTTLTSNIKNYLNNFKLLTDVITINDGYIVNFGVFFDIIAEKYANKQQVKLDCIQKIKDYFRIEKMQFNQPIYKSQLEFELMGVEGVRSIGHITITQEEDYFPLSDNELLTPPTFLYSYTPGEGDVDIDGDGNEDGDFVTTGTAGYGYKYDFKTALSDDGTIIVPPNTATPTVFELKNPNQNIQGRVR